MSKILGKEGEALLNAMLAHEPAARIQPQHALLHPYICRASITGPSSSQPADKGEAMKASSQPDAALKLWSDKTGNTSFQGERAPWKLLHGSLQDNVLEYLRGDGFFRTDAAELRRKELQSFNEPQQGKNKSLSCRQKGCKMIISGGLGDPCSKSLNAMRIDKPFPVDRVAKWREAFVQVNKAAFTQLDRDIKSKLRELPSGELRENGEHALEQPWETWALTGGNLFLTQAGRSHQGGVHLLEDDHVDGGAGIMLLAITLFGKRLLHCWNSAETRSTSLSKEENKLQFPQQPGTVWLTCASSFRHQVEHLPSDDLMTFGDLDRLSVAVIMRSTLFPYNRARVGKHTPNPKIVFKTIAKAVALWQGKHTLRLPTLEHITTTHLKTSTSAKRQPIKRGSFQAASSAAKKKKMRTA